MLPTGWPPQHCHRHGGANSRLAMPALGGQQPCEAKEVTAGNRKGFCVCGNIWGYCYQVMGLWEG